MKSLIILFLALITLGVLLIISYNRKRMKEKLAYDLDLFEETQHMSLIEVNALINERVSNNAERRILMDKIKYLRNIKGIS